MRQKGRAKVIEVKDVKYDPNERVEICAGRLQELLESEDLGMNFYKLLKAIILQRYVENYACFGNGGGFTCEELAELMHIELPKTAHIGMEEYLKIKNEIGGGKKNG